jgi:hypothetical protein
MDKNDTEKLVYVPIPEFTKTEMQRAIAEDDIEKLIYVPLFASLYYEDRDFAEEICLKLSEHTHFNVRAMAIEGFGHIARIDRKLNKEIIKPIIEKTLKDKDEFVRQKAEDAKDDIKHFLKWKFNK